MAGVLPEPEDDRADVLKSAHGPSWSPSWPQRPRGELVSALDADWGEIEKAGDKIKARAHDGVEFSSAEVQQATRDSISRSMLIRAYRARGHFYANLDPLGLEPP